MKKEYWNGKFGILIEEVGPRKYNIHRLPKAVNLGRTFNKLEVNEVIEWFTNHEHPTWEEWKKFLRKGGY